MVIDLKNLAKSIWERHPDLASDAKRHCSECSGNKTTEVHHLVEEVFSYGLDLGSEELEEMGLGEYADNWHSIQNSIPLLAELCRLQFKATVQFGTYTFEEPESWEDAVSEALEMM